MTDKPKSASGMMLSNPAYWVCPHCGRSISDDEVTRAALIIQARRIEAVRGAENEKKPAKTRRSKREKA